MSASAIWTFVRSSRHCATLAKEKAKEKAKRKAKRKAKEKAKKEGDDYRR